MLETLFRSEEAGGLCGSPKGTSCFSTEPETSPGPTYSLETEPPEVPRQSGGEGAGCWRVENSVITKSVCMFSYSQVSENGNLEKLTL